MEKRYNEWNMLKVSLDDRSIGNLYFKEREIWFCSVGCNVGSEQNGKNRLFERPVLILKKWNKHCFLGVPLSTKIKKGKHYKILENNGIKYCFLLSQLRLWDSRRLLRRVRIVSFEDFLQVNDSLEGLLFKKTIPLNLAMQGISEPEGHCVASSYQRESEKSSRVYLDHAAATPVDDEVMQEMTPWFSDKFANPSSLHRAGQMARAAVDGARMKIASFLGVQATEVFFTSSGTESCNWAIRGVLDPLLRENKDTHLIVSAVEHSAILDTARFLENSCGLSVSYLKPDADGIISADALREALRDETALVSIMAVNNEIGTIQPISKLASVCREAGVLMHTDACQASAELELDVDKLGVDMMTINAAKIYGPKGIGLLYVSEGVALDSWTLGGYQEFRKRAGTENVPAIVGFAKALELAQRGRESFVSYVEVLRDKLWNDIQEKIDDVELNGCLEGRAVNNLNIWIKGVDGETLVKRMDLEGFEFSTGSACSAGEVKPSHVLLAIGKDEEMARSSIRLSLGKNNTEEELRKFVDTLVKIVDELRKSC